MDKQTLLKKFGKKRKNCEDKKRSYARTAI